MMSAADLLKDPEQEKAATALGDTRFDAMRPIGRRRVLVLVALAVYAVTVAMLAVDGLAPALASPPMMAVSLGLVWLLQRVVRAMADLPSAYIDERIEHVRNLAHKRAFAIFSGMAMLGVLVFQLVAELRDAPLAVTSSHAFAAFWALILLASSLPSMVLAWTEPEI